MFMVWHPGVRCAEFSEIVVVSGPAGAPHEPVVGDDELVNRFQTATTGIVMVRFWRPLTNAGVTFWPLSRRSGSPGVSPGWRVGSGFARFSQRACSLHDLITRGARFRKCREHALSAKHPFPRCRSDLGERPFFAGAKNSRVVKTQTKRLQGTNGAWARFE